MQRIAYEDQTATSGAVPGGLTGRAYRMNEYTFSLDADDPALDALFDELLKPFVVAERAVGTRVDSYVVRREDGLVRISFNGNEVVPALLLEEAVERVLREVGSAGINSTSNYLAVHAGAVSRAGAAAIFPAPSGSGKSTTTAALVQAGCGYLSDEAAMIDLASGVVHPYPRPLCLSAASLAALAPLSDDLPLRVDWPARERHVAPCQLAGGPVSEPAPLRALFVLSFDHSAAVSCEPIRRSEAMLAVITNSFNFARFAPAGLASLAAVIAQVSPYRLRFGNLIGAVAKVVEVLEGLAGADAG